MIVDIDDYMKKMSKNLNDLDWMVISISFKASHEVEENSDMGRMITKMMSIYHQFLKTNDQKYEKILRKHYIEYFYPNYSKKSVSITNTYKQGLKVGGQPQELPMKTVSIETADKERNELFGEKNIIQKDEIFRKIASAGAQETTNARLDEMSKLLNEFAMQQQLILSELLNRSEQQDKTLTNIAQDQGIIVKGQEFTKNVLDEIKGIVSGNLTIGGVLSAAFVGLAKLMFFMIKMTLKVFKSITIDLWWSPVSLFVKATTRYSRIFAGGIIFIIIGATIFTFFVNSDPTKMCYSPQIGFSKFCMYPSFTEAITEEGKDLFATWLGGLLYVFKYIGYHIAEYPMGALGYSLEDIKDSFTKITFGQMYHLDENTLTFSNKEFMDNLWQASLGKTYVQYAADLLHFYGGSIANLFNNILIHSGIKEQIDEQANALHESLQEQYPLYKIAYYLSSLLGNLSD